MAGERTLPGLGLRAFWNVGSNNWELQHDPDTRLLSVLCQGSVLSRVTSLPGVPTDGDIYIIPVGDADANKIAARDNGAWVLYTPLEGWQVYDKNAEEFVYWDGAVWVAQIDGVDSIAAMSDFDNTPAPADGQIMVFRASDSKWYPADPAAAPALDGLSDVSVPTPTTGDLLGWNGTAWVSVVRNNLVSLDNLTDVAVSGPATNARLAFNGTAWVPVVSQIGVGAFVPGVPSISSLIVQYVVPVAFSIPSGGTGSRGYAATAPSGTVAFDLQKNGVSFGTMTFTSANVATFTVGSTTSFAAGDRLTIHSPSNVHAMADVSANLLGTL